MSPPVRMYTQRLFIKLSVPSSQGRASLYIVKCGIKFRTIDDFENEFFKLCPYCIFENSDTKCNQNYQERFVGDRWMSCHAFDYDPYRNNKKGTTHSQDAPTGLICRKTTYF